MTNDKIKTNSWHIINDSLVELRYTEDMDYHIEADYISPITAVFTTANARIRLMAMLHWLHPSQVIYCDTDSVMFVYDKTNPDHKNPDGNDDITKPSNVNFGNALGDWENEFGKDEWIVEIVVAGVKSYAYKTNKGKIVIRMKGITLDRNNCNDFTFERIKDMVLTSEKLVSEERFQFIWNKDKQIETRQIKRTVQATMDSKRVVLDNYYSLPFGYEL
jgi:hypothetical protein